MEEAASGNGECLAYENARPGAPRREPQARKQWGWPHRVFGSAPARADALARRVLEAARSGLAAVERRWAVRHFPARRFGAAGHAHPSAGPCPRWRCVPRHRPPRQRRYAGAPATERPGLNIKESPLAWLAQRRDKDGKPMIGASNSMPASGCAPISNAASSARGSRRRGTRRAASRPTARRARGRARDGRERRRRPPARRRGAEGGRSGAVRRAARRLLLPARARAGRAQWRLAAAGGQGRAAAGPGPPGPPLRFRPARRSDGPARDPELAAPEWSAAAADDATTVDRAR